MINQQNYNNFKQLYAVKLKEAIRRNPLDYDYSEEFSSIVVDRMLPEIIKGSAMMSAPLKAAARAVGIKQSMKAIQEYLNAI